MSFPDEQLWIIRLERQSKKDSYIKPNFKQKSAILHPLLYWATFPYPTAGAKLHPLVLLPPKTTLSSLLTWGIFWLPRNFSAIKWQSSQACPGTVYYQSTSGELSDHKGWQIKLRSHWPNHRADRRNTAGGDRVGGHWTSQNIIFLMCTFLRMAKSGGVRTPAHSDCFLLPISCSNTVLHSKVLAIHLPKRKQLMTWVKRQQEFLEL